MTTFIFSNGLPPGGAVSFLSGPISNVATTCSLAAGTGALFPSPGAGQAFPLTFIDAATGNLAEIVYCTARSTDTLTIVRGQEGTTALSWLAGDLADHFVTAGSLNSFANAALTRTRLQSALILYVSNAGNDSNNGLTSGTPFLTLQHAVNVAYQNYDAALSTVTIQCADGTYAGFTIGGALTGIGGAGTLIIQGNVGTPANVIISAPASNCVTASFGSQVTLTGVTLTATGSGQVGNAVLSANGAIVYIGASVVFGACGQYHLYTEDQGLIAGASAYTISGNAVAHWASDAGTTNLSGITITLTGSPVFSGTFAIASNAGRIKCPGNTFSGSAGAVTVRYSAVSNGVINTGGGGATYIPGTSAGSVATGGQYI